MLLCYSKLWHMIWLSIHEVIRIRTITTVLKTERSHSCFHPTYSLFHSRNGLISEEMRATVWVGLDCEDLSEKDMQNMLCILHIFFRYFCQKRFFRRGLDWAKFWKKNPSFNSPLLPHGTKNTGASERAHLVFPHKKANTYPGCSGAPLQSSCTLWIPNTNYLVHTEMATSSCAKWILVEFRATNIRSLLVSA